MTGKKTKTQRIVIFLMILFLAVQAFIPAALADDAELLEIIPGQWILSDEVEDVEGEPYEADLAILLFEEDGSVYLSCDSRNAGYAYSCVGTWSFELVAGGMDRLTILFTSTDDPAQAGSEYSLECIYDVYAESWVEDDTWYIYLLLEGAGSSGITPFEDVYGYNDLALHRERHPNMRVCNCNSYVSLRAKPSTSSARLVKVPLGALVLAFPEFGEEDGFIYCEYHDYYGYILSKYLQPIEN
ncbi:MAG: SH3 domain-containing protein [Clostridia bacterium]|nr:SH3 domain-containing protein [Clostridia bacterium]